jgi:nucleoside-diphosphate-sugar epimerase
MVRTIVDSQVNRKKVLVTGGSGFLGSHVVDALLRAGHEVRIFDRVPNAAHPDLCHVGDICDPQECRKALAGMDVLMHLAALYRDDVRPRSLYYKVNVDGTAALLEAAGALAVNRVVFASSFSVYGLDNVAGGEDSQLAPVNDYGHSKLAAEKLVREWVAASADRSAAMVRPSVIFGPGNRGNVYVLLQQIASKWFVLLGSGANPKSMSFVGNVAAFFCWLLERRSDALEIYNYADKPDMTVREIVGLAGSTLGTSTPRVPMPKVAILALGRAGNLVEHVTRRPFTINLERVRKFIADTSLPVERLTRSGFVAPFDFRKKFVETAEFEFGAARERGKS